MYGSNSWNHQRQGLMPSLLGNPYAAAMYSNVQYSQPLMSFQQQQRQQQQQQQQQPPPQNKPRYMGGPNSQHHNRNMNKTNDRKSPERHKSVNHDIPPQNIPSKEATPQSNDIVPDNKETNVKDQEENQNVEEGDATIKLPKKSPDENLEVQNVPDSTSPKELQGNKTDPHLPSKQPLNSQTSSSSGSEDKVDSKKDSQLEADESNSTDSKSSFKLSGDGTKQFPFYCELCDAKCNSESNYKDHMLGSRHLRNVKIKGSMKSPNSTPESHLGTKLSCISDPLIGLNFVTEFQSPDPQAEDKYFCSLCQVRGNARVTIAHITGIKHRMAVLHECYPDQHERICNQPNRELMSKTVSRIVSDIEKRFGRGAVNVVTDSHPDFPLKRPASTPDKPIDNKRLRTDKFPTKRDQDFTSDSIDQPYTENRGRIDFETENKENKSFSNDGYIDNQKFSSPNVGGRYQKNEKSYWQDGNDNPIEPPFEMHQYDDADLNVHKERLPRLKPIEYGHNRQITDYEGGMQSDDYGRRQDPHLQSDKPKVQEQDPFEKFLNDDPNNLSLSKGNLGTLLKVLTKCVIKNEEDAEMALQVSNALTKSLLKYRLQNMPAEVLSATLQSSKKMLFGDTLKSAPPAAPPHSETPISGTPRSGATPAPPPSLPPPPLPQVTSTSLLPTPAVAPTAPHYRPMSGYSQQHYDRY